MVYDEIPDSLLTGRLSTLLKSNKAGKSSEDKDVGKGSLGIRENKFTAYYNVETASDGGLTSAAVGVQRSASSDNFGESEIRLKFENEPPSPLTHEMTSALECMTSDDVVAVLTKLKLSKYANSFKNQLVDGVILTQLTTDTLREDFGMTRLEAIRLMTFIERGHLPK
nr:hypothetical protein BaRGS_026949 [Batillaria attramentaria]